MADGRVTIDTRLDSKGLKYGLNVLPSQIAPILKKVGGMIASYLSVRALVNFSKQSIALASDLQEVQNVVDTAFGEMSYKMEEFSEIAIQQYGISKLAAKQTGSTYMSMARSLGLSLDTASDMALSLTALSADMASFYNVEQSVADVALKSVFTGETETLKKYGIVMTEVNLQEFAYSQGIQKKIKDMNQSEKVQLRYAYVMQQTALAQGDFAKTQDSYANQTRILSESWKEFMSILGSGLIKVVTPAIKLLNQLVASLISATKALFSLLGIDISVGTATAGAAQSVEDLSGGMDDTAKSTKKAGKAASKSLASFDELNNLSSGSGSGGSGSGGSGGGMSITPPTIDTTNTKTAANEMLEQFSGVIKLIGKLFSRLSSIFRPIVNDLKKMWNSFLDVLSSTESRFAAIQMLDSIIDYLRNVFEFLALTIEDTWSHLVSPVLSSFIENIVPVIIQLLGELMATFSSLMDVLYSFATEVWEGTVVPVFDLLATIITDVFTDIKAAWDKWGHPIFQQLRQAISEFGEVLSNIYNTILKPILDKIISTLKSVWENNLEPLVANILDFLGVLIDTALKFWNNVLQPLVQSLISYIGPNIVRVASNVIDIVGNLLKTIIDLINLTITKFKGILTFLGDVFVGDWEKAWEDIQKVFVDCWEGIQKVFKDVINVIISLLNSMIDGFESAINSLLEGLNAIDIDIPEGIPGLGGKHIGFDLKPVNFGRIPKLASGAVIPPNKEFMAILGDQKSGTNIEAPLDTIKQALAEVLASTNQDIIIQIDGREVFKAVQNQSRKYTKSTGLNAFS